MSVDGLDEWFPPQGPCALCGEGDARHRIIDAIAERHEAGDSLELLADDYGLPVEAIQAAVSASECG